MAKGDLCAKGPKCKNYGWKQDAKQNLPARVKTNSKYCSDCREILQAMRRKKARLEAASKTKKSSAATPAPSVSKAAKPVIPKREVYIDSEVSTFQESAQPATRIKHTGSLLSDQMASGVTPTGEKVDMRLYNDGSPAGIRPESPYSIKVESVAMMAS